MLQNICFPRQRARFLLLWIWYQVQISEPFRSRSWPARALSPSFELQPVCRASLLHLGPRRGIESIVGQNLTLKSEFFKDPRGTARRRIDEQPLLQFEVRLLQVFSAHVEECNRRMATVQKRLDVRPSRLFDPFQGVEPINDHFYTFTVEHTIV